MCCAEGVAVKYYIIFINKELKTIHSKFVTELHNNNEKPTNMQCKAQFHFKKNKCHIPNASWGKFIMLIILKKNRRDICAKQT